MFSGGREEGIEKKERTEGRKREHWPEVRERERERRGAERTSQTFRYTNLHCHSNDHLTKLI